MHPMVKDTLIVLAQMGLALGVIILAVATLVGCAVLIILMAH